MALDETGKYYLDKVLTGADAVLSIGATAAGSNNLANIYITGHSVVMNSTKNYAGGQNSYQAIGKAVGDAISLVGFGEILGVGKFLGMTSKITLNAGASVAVNERDEFDFGQGAIGDMFSTAFDTYVRNADEFYTRLATDESYREDVKNELSSMFSGNYLNELGNYYSNVTFDKFWEDIKGIYAPPPASGQGSLVYTQSVSSPNHASIQANDVNVQKAVTEVILRDTSINKLTLNNQTYNIASDNNNLLVRNALDSIPAVSILLSHIDIYAGEKIDLGNKGIYTVKSGDTFSQIANNNGFNTKELLKRNTWLTDEGKVHFDQDKVLVDINASDLTRVNHTLYGTNAEDILKDLNGGYDTYIAGNKDTITDSDGKGNVLFEGIDLTGNKKKNHDGRYYDDDFYYDPSGSTLTVSTKDGSKSITINNYNQDTKEVLGIKLGNEDIEVSISDASAVEAAESMTFTVSLSRALEDGEELTVNAQGHSLVFASGEKSKTFDYTWSDDTIPEDNVHFTVTPSIADYQGPDDVKVTVKDDGKGTIFDDDEDKRHDPLALDTNKDGFISTSNLENSGTYFDITGDGLRERVGWVKAQDALLVYDKNENNQIDGISEVFGNANESGFEELKRVADSNYDGKIDRRDELYIRLQVWHDNNQDAKVQAGELTSLQEEGIKSINLNYVKTDIEIEGNLLTEASKYTDNQGNKELAADIQLKTDAKDTKVDIAAIPDFTVDESTKTLPKLNGSGLVYDSFILYNTNPEFKAIAKEMAGNIKRVATEFDTFMDNYSGYTAYINELQEKYSVDNISMAPIDREAWIVERFEATDTLSKPIENYYESNLSNGRIPLNPITKDSSVTHKYNFIEGKIESTFAMESIFKNEFGATHYDFDN